MKMCAYEVIELPDKRLCTVFYYNNGAVRCFIGGKVVDESIVSQIIDGKRLKYVNR